MHSTRSVRYVAMLVAAFLCTCTPALGNDYIEQMIERGIQRLKTGSGMQIIGSSEIFVGEIEKVVWEPDARVPGRSGNATFAVRNGLRGVKQGEKIVLQVHGVQFGTSLLPVGQLFWVGLRFTEGSLWLVFVGNENDNVRYLSQLPRVDHPVVGIVGEVTEIDSKEPEDKLKAIREVLEEKPLERVLRVNYGIQAAKRLVRTHPEACSILLSVAGESDNPARIRVAAMDAIQRYLASGYRRDERTAWKEQLKMILEAAPVMKDEPLELLYRYSSLLLSGVRRGSREREVLIPADVKVESPEKVKAALNSVAERLDESIPSKKDELAAAQSQDTTFPTEQQREQRIAELQRSIEATENMSKRLKTLAESPALQPAPVPEDDEK